jgi:PST family polysaccharide transporter
LGFANVITRFALGEIESQAKAAKKTYSDLWLVKSSPVIFMSYFIEIPDLPTAQQTIEQIVNQPWTMETLIEKEKERADTTVARDNRECNRMVNEQAEVGLLLAGPGVLATLTFAPWVMLTFYSSKFGPAVEILRWICLGMILRVVSWPMGFILLAKGARQPFFWSELTTSLVQVGLVWVLLLNRGLEGTGMAFFGSYAFYWVLIYVIVRSASGFRWSAANKGLGLLFSVLATGVFIAWYWLPRPAVVIGGAIITLLAGIYSMRKLCTLVSLERLPKPLRRLLVLFRFTKG